MRDKAVPAEIKFYRVKDAFGCFSNFSAHPVFIDTTWPTTEHFFQAEKFTDHAIRSEIQMEKSPMKAAKLGRSRDLPIRSDWETVKDDVMRTAIRAKVVQHADVRETLLATGSAKIIEHTKNDNYWGDGGDGAGKNMLGLIWMQIRDELTTNGPFDELAVPMLPPWLKYPEIERLSIGWRMGFGEDYDIGFRCWFKGLTKDGQSQYKQMYTPPKEWADFYDHI